jgi:hypothetical protein
MNLQPDHPPIGTKPPAGAEPETKDRDLNLIRGVSFRAAYGLD